MYYWWVLRHVLQRVMHTWYNVLYMYAHTHSYIPSWACRDSSVHVGTGGVLACFPPHTCTCNGVECYALLPPSLYRDIHPSTCGDNISYHVISCSLHSWCWGYWSIGGYTNPSNTSLTPHIMLYTPCRPLWRVVWYVVHTHTAPMEGYAWLTICTRARGDIHPLQ